MEWPITEACTHAITVAQANKNWVDIFSALLLPMIAILGAYIALNQWLTNRNRLKHELFDRRYAQYVALGKFLGNIRGGGGSVGMMLERCKDELRGMAFIYDQKIYEHVKDKILKPASDLDTINSEIQPLVGIDLQETSQSKEERTRLRAEARRIKDALEEEFKGLDKLLGAYLKLSN